VSPDPELWMDRNGAVNCAAHKGTEGWKRIAAPAVQAFRRDCARLGLVSMTEPLCEACRLIAGRSGGVLTGEDA